MRPHAILSAVVLAVCAACGAAESAEQPAGCPADLGRLTSGGDELGVYGPSWSPDGERIAFSTTTELYVLTLETCAVSSVRPAGRSLLVDSVDWSPDGASFAFVSGPGPDEGLWLMGSDGSRPRPVARGAIVFPAWSPDGRRIAFIEDRVDEVAATEDRNVWVVNADGTGRRRVTTGAWHGSVDWSPDGKWLVSDAAGGLIRIRPDGTGRSFVARGEYAEPAWSPDGGTIALQGPRLVPLGGGSVPSLDVVAGGAFEPAWSPDGRLLAFTDGENEPDLWIAEADGGGLRRLTSSR